MEVFGVWSLHHVLVNRQPRHLNAELFRPRVAYFLKESSEIFSCFSTMKSFINASLINPQARFSPFVWFHPLNLQGYKLYLPAHILKLTGTVNQNLSRIKMERRSFTYCRIHIGFYLNFFTWYQNDILTSFWPLISVYHWVKQYIQWGKNALLLVTKITTIKSCFQ